MLKTALAFALLPLFLLPSIAMAVQVNYDVYIIAGQSNADGRALASELPTGSPLAGIQSNASISYLNPGEPGSDADVSSNGFVALQPGFSVAPGENRNAGVPSDTDYFGPELSFAASIGQATGSSNPVAIIKVTRGGTSLREDWRVGGDAEPGVATGFLYSALLEHIGDSLTELTAGGNTADIKGFLWHQGESDRNSAGSTYNNRFTDLVEGVREEFGGNIPVVLGELAQRDDPETIVDQDNLGTNDAFNAGLADLVDSVPSLALVSSEGLLTVTTDDTHFDTDSQVILGERFAAAFGTLTAVPEPSSSLLIGSLALGLAVRRRRR